MDRGATVIISPHLDDAVFSLGGAMLTGRLGKITVVSMFTRSSYCIDGLGDIERVTEMRAAEDREALALVGARRAPR